MCLGFRVTVCSGLQTFWGLGFHAFRTTGCLLPWPLLTQPRRPRSTPDTLATTHIILAKLSISHASLQNSEVAIPNPCHDVPTLKPHKPPYVLRVCNIYMIHSSSKIRGLFTLPYTDRILASELFAHRFSLIARA